MLRSWIFFAFLVPISTLAAQVDSLQVSAFQAASDSTDFDLLDVEIAATDAALQQWLLAFEKAIQPYDREAALWVRKTFGPLILDPALGLEFNKDFLARMELFTVRKVGVHPGQFEYVRSVQALLAGLTTPDHWREWDAFVQAGLADAGNARALAPVLPLGKPLLTQGVFFTSDAVTWRYEGAWRLEGGGKPQLLFNGGELLGLAKGDTVRVTDLRGLVNFKTGRLKGESGRIDWRRAALDPALNYATFGAFDLRLKGSSLSLDSALFRTDVFPEPLLGRITDKASAMGRGSKATYPRFDSYLNRLEIDEIAPGVNFSGGLTIRGSALEGKGSGEEPAELVFLRENKPLVRCTAPLIILKSDVIRATDARAVVYFDQGPDAGLDSLYHPELDVRYHLVDRRLSLLRDDEGLGPKPFIDSYHALTVDVTQLVWQHGDPRLLMQGPPGSAKSDAELASLNCFQKERYEAMQGMADLHPLVEVRNAVRHYNDSLLTSRDVGRFLRISEDQAHIMLMLLAQDGYVDMDVETRVLRVKPQLFDHLKNYAGRRDYDVLHFNSTSKGRNGFISLLNHRMLLEGVDRILVSQRRNVLIRPLAGQVVIEKDRDFDFGGTLHAGNLQFEGSDYHFDYETFTVELNKVETCKLRMTDPEDVDPYGRPRKKQIRNNLSEVSGTLRIDAPSNRSGWRAHHYPEYPVLNTDGPSYVFWDAPSVQAGAYTRDRFYFTTEPFRLDSLDDLGRNELRFQGVLNSGGILPDIVHELAVMDDMYLGFETATDPGGWPLYGGAAHYNRGVKLDGKGLQGGGKIEFLTSSAQSDRFTLLPDSTVGVADNFVNSISMGPPEVPVVTGEGAYVAFHPNERKLTARSRGNPLQFFGAESGLTGRLTLADAGMHGAGTMAFEGAELRSELFNYLARSMVSDTAAFEMLGGDELALAFQTDNVHAEINFDARVGDFVANDGESRIELPANQYACYMDRFKWFIDKDQLELFSDREIDDDFVINTEGREAVANFVSLRPEQDSLQFSAPRALYDVENQVLSCKKVPYIRVADALVLPDSGLVVIRKRAVMDVLKRAGILANEATRYHRLFDARVEVTGRYKYRASADYEYKDENELGQIIHFAEVGVDTSRQTVASGLVHAREDFSLSPFFGFSGEALLAAGQEHLRFIGGATLLAGCPEMDRMKLAFDSEIDPKDIYIPIDTTLRDVLQSHLGAGFFFRDPYDPGGGPYATFGDRLRGREDERLLSATGDLHFDKRKGSYLIGPRDKMQRFDLPGNLIELKQGGCAVTGYGGVDFPFKYGMMTLKAAGEVQGFTTASGLQSDLSMAWDFPFDDGVWKTLAEMISTWPTADPLDVTSTTWEADLRHWLGLEGADKVWGSMTMMGSFKKTPESIEHRLLLTGMELEWDAGEDAFISKGSLGLVSMGRTPVFRELKGKLEMSTGRGGDRVRLYLHMDEDNWYFFDYRNGIMNISTTDQLFIDAIVAIKSDKRKFKSDAGRFSYQVLPTHSRRNEFIDRFEEFD